MSPRIHSTGDVVGDRYEIQDYVGAGGMQEVYLAVDRVLERNVAVKVPKNTSAERRFNRSAILSARVNHPNAAKTLDYVQEGERSYLVEEFILGEDLAKVRDRLPIMDPYLVAHVLHHLARGVAASHHVGVVHRDLKPSNIMVSSRLTFELIKVTDFGIAKMAEEELALAVGGGGESSITGSQTMMGALPYMAPEMIQNPRTAGKPADVWALGSIAYELLCGSKPFGTGLQAVPQILGGAPPAMPRPLAKPQFKGLGTELFDAIQKCWDMNAPTRPSADEVVATCGQLCYPPSSRLTGTVEEKRFPQWGFISTGEGRVFFHVDSVYGPSPEIGDKVCLAVFSGSPHPRGHPVVKMG